MRKRGWAVAGLGPLVLLLAACGNSSTSPGSAYGSSSAAPMSSPSSSSMPSYGSGMSGTSGGTAAQTTTLTIKKTSIGDVLVNAKGYTLYWYGKDHQGGPSTCTGSCLGAWPAVTGKPVAAMGVTFAGRLGSDRDPGGTVQATYNGYPLYTYAQDMAPGETAGNGVGGVWHVVTGKFLVASTTSSGMGSSSSESSGSSGGSYGSGSSW
jgi:predicted lipoprotein with Yx(FWY)xxD motif